MVWPFRKKKILDLTSSNNKIPESVRKRLELEYKDLTSKPAKQEVNATSEESSVGSSALGFLGSLAGASKSSESSIGSEIEDIHIKHLKVKIEDIEYKFDSLSRQLGKIMDRLDLAEKKIDKIERRGL